MGDFLSYIWSLIWSWLGLLAASAGAALALSERQKKKEVHPRLYVIILLGFLMVGFMAWHDQRIKSDTLTKEVEEINKHKPMPDIRFAVEDMMVGKLLETPPSDSVVMLYLTVRNVGQMPSAVDRYLLKVDVQNRGTITAENIVVSDAVIVQSPEGERVKIDRSNAIYKKTLDPLMPGAMKQGIMAFLFRGVREQELVNATYTLSWYDGLAKPGSITSKVSLPPAGWRPPFIPGIDEEDLPRTSPTATPN